jgi:hypothetical protein
MRIRGPPRFPRHLERSREISLRASQDLGGFVRGLVQPTPLKINDSLAGQVGA